MKSLRVFLCLLLAGALMTACQKNSVDELVTSKKSEAEFVLSSTNPIEYTTLEGLNKVLVENGLEPTTLEKLDITQEEYDAAQARLWNPSIAKSRCSGSTAVEYLDMNNNGSVSGLDISWAHQVILGTRSPSSDSALFGQASAIWPTLEDGATSPPSNPNTALTSYDLVLAQKVVLGIYVCQ